ncbi:NAD-dependent epimerase/dehydratase family protein [Leucobacter soli]|uniref:NAD-dependent epimerase/dehydratase family protein n=1 Tax=Leucobacter soli TaxID=2812850 RepID=UPI0036239918
MRILVVGATGQVGAIVAGALGERHEVIGLSRSSDPRLDLLDADSISAALTRIGRVDAVVDCAGGAPFLPLRQLTSELVLAGVRTKMLGKVDLLLHGHPWVADGGSFTFTTGITARRVVPGEAWRRSPTARSSPSCAPRRPRCRAASA